MAAAQNRNAAADISLPTNYRAPVFKESSELQRVLADSVNATVAASPGFKPVDIAATLIDLRDTSNLTWANVAGEKKIYPASVVKMFYMVALERDLESGKVVSTPELQRGLKDMIVDSSNEATQYILDVLTGTSSGAELPANEFEKWQFKRNRVNRFYTALGYQNINVNQKTFCEDAYGIEQQTRRYKGENRNMLTTNATARLMAEIVLGKMNTPVRTRSMLDLMKRDPFAVSTDPDSQALGFSGKALVDRKMTTARLWSKAGWTSKTRHDVAYVETGEGSKFVIAIFTENHANRREVIPAVVDKIIERLKKRVEVGS